MILDGRAIAATSLTEPATNLRTSLLACYPKISIPPLDHVVLTSTPMIARVNHGIWIASCSCGAKGVPTPGCIVFLDTPYGWCVRCGNQAWGHGWRPIIIPTEHERRLIEAILMCRPNPENHNWSPDETIEMLAVENVAHGCPVPDLDVIRIGPVHGPSISDLSSPFPSPDVMRRVLADANPRRGIRRLIGR